MDPMAHVNIGSMSSGFTRILTVSIWGLPSRNFGNPMAPIRSDERRLWQEGLEALRSMEARHVTPGAQVGRGYFRNFWF